MSKGGASGAVTEVVLVRGGDASVLTTGAIKVYDVSPHVSSEWQSMAALNTSLDSGNLSDSFATDVSAYRDFAVLMDVSVTGAPTDLTIKAQYSSNIAGPWRTLQNWFWADLTWDDATVDDAAWDHPAFQDRCPTQFMRIFATMTTASAGTFTLANCELHLKD